MTTNEELKAMRMLARKPIDFTKPVQTVSGLPVVIYDTEFNNGNGSVLGVITHKDGYKEVHTFLKSGAYNSNRFYNPYDLINVSQKKSGWINLYTDRGGDGANSSFRIYATKEEAVAEIQSERYITTIRIEWEE